MKSRPTAVISLLVALVFASVAVAQQAVSDHSPNPLTVPLQIKFTGVISTAPGDAVGVTFALFSEQTGGAPLWRETQRVTVDDKGGYTVYLGANHADGVPAELFANVGMRWLGVQPEGLPEQMRVLVAPELPVAAGNPQILGGKPLGLVVKEAAPVSATGGGAPPSPALTGLSADLSASHAPADQTQAIVPTDASTESVSRATTETTVDSASGSSAPGVLTLPAALNASRTAIVINGKVNPYGLPTTYWFEYGTQSAHLTPSPSQSLPVVTSQVAVSTTSSALSPHATYYFRVAASNGGGTSRGQILRFRALNHSILTFLGTQSPGDFWSWTVDNTAGTFTAVNNTANVDYSGSTTTLTGNAAGISKVSVTATTDPSVTTPQTAYAIEVPNTALLVATAPFFLGGFNSVPESIHPPVFAVAQGSCPASGVNANWIIMPPANWCSTVGDVNPLGHGCSQADNAYGTARISVSGSIYGIAVNQYRLDGTPAGSMNLSGCSCSNGLIQCTDPSNNPVRISLTPSGVFFVDMASSAVAGIVQPSSSIDLTDFLKSGRTFRAIYHTALDSSGIFCTQASCTNNGGTWLNLQGGLCGTHTTQVASAVTNGTQIVGYPYSNIDNGITSSTNGGVISFNSASQTTAPGLITATFNDLQGGTSPIVMAVRQVNGKYVALIVTRSPNATLGGGFNVLAVEQ
jgi:hypothetical protein